MRPVSAIRRSLLVALAPLALCAAAHAEPARVSLTGFVDSSLGYTFTPEALTHDGVRLGLDQVELDVDATLTTGLRVRADLNWFPAEVLNPDDGAAYVIDSLVEQAFGEFFCSGDGHGFFVRAGKWNAPIGFEVIDPTGLWQYSQGLLFTHAAPSNLTGVALGWVGATTQAQLWVTNDWDLPTTPKDASLGGRVQQALGDVGTLGLSVMYGALVDDPGRLMIDLDLALTFGKLRLGAEANYGKRGDARSLGFLVSGNYAFSDRVSATLRVDYLDRDIADFPYKGASVTGAGLFTLTPGLTLVAELRADLPDGQDTIVGGALELTAAF